MSELTVYNILLGIIIAPFAGSLIAGLFGQFVGRVGAHSVTILGVAISFVLSCIILNGFLFEQISVLNIDVYHWAYNDTYQFKIGFLLDNLTALMMVVVTFVSLMVHIYTIGYMKDDPGYQRFFSYIALFTFSMLMLVMSNNFLQLFFGWEAVGVISYLLIGFWFKRDSATFAGLKAFLVNRVGDFGFLIGIAAVFYFFGSLDYLTVFDKVPQFIAGEHTIDIIPGIAWSAITVICIALFIGAMGKSAQMPLHVWLPDSMEGPTPISALIHAATMVTAGVFMVARMSPLFEYSEVARSFILVIGGSTAFFMGLLGIVQTDIKRVIAYSTLSQLGYMFVAAGASAYAAGIFHLMTHAFFKALLFLAAGAVIIAMHHDQDMRNMGNLRKYMPITYICSLIGAIALCGIPPFAGFYSKDSIIEMVGSVNLPGSDFAYLAVLLSVFVTALYTFRLIFLVFHTKERMDQKTREHLHEVKPVVWWPLVALSIPSVIVGVVCIGPFLMDPHSFFANSIFVLPQHAALFDELQMSYHGPWAMALHALVTWPFWLAIAGVVTAWYCYIVNPGLPEKIATGFKAVYRIMLNKYGFDQFNQFFFVRGSRILGCFLWQKGDEKIIDGIMVNGTANSIGMIARVLRRIQSGYLYHYAFAMIIGLLAFITWLLWL